MGVGLGVKYPAAKDNFVNDYANVLTAKDAERIRTVAQATLRERGVPIVVATIGSLAEYDAADWSIERYATNLYNEWGIGDRTTNRGVLLLVSVRDRKLRIATGTGLGNLDGPARQVIDSVIVPRFKAADLSGGIALGVEAIAKWFQPTGTATATGTTPPEQTPAGEGAAWTPRGTQVSRDTRMGLGGLSCFFCVILLFIGLSVVSRIFRGSSRNVPMSGYSGVGSGGGGWGRFLLGGLTGFAASQFLQGSRRRNREWDSSGFFDGGSSFGGGDSGSSSFGGGFSSGGGASGSW